LQLVYNKRVRRDTKEISEIVGVRRPLLDDGRLNIVLTEFGRFTLRNNHEHGNIVQCIGAVVDISSPRSHAQVYEALTLDEAIQATPNPV